MLESLISKFGQTDYVYSTTVVEEGTSSAFNVTWAIISMALAVLIIASMWRVFTKARKPGWAAIIPIYNTYVMLKIIGRPGWWLLLYFIPVVNIVVGLIVGYELVKAFGKGVGFFIFMLFLPFIAYPVLAFGDAKYTKPKMVS